MMKTGNRSSGRRSPMGETERSTEHIHRKVDTFSQPLGSFYSRSMTCKKLKIARRVEPETECQANATSENGAYKLGRFGIEDERVADRVSYGVRFEHRDIVSTNEMAGRTLLVAGYGS
jgi:hypothetical protein